LAPLQQALRDLSDPAIAAHSARFFKSGPGEYGEGDRFRGIRVPALRRLAHAHRDLPLANCLELLRSPWHEDRLLALLLWGGRYARGDDGLRGEIYACYLDNTRYINNWDLVDSSAEHIVGTHLLARDREALDRLAASGNLWERRIAVMATFRFIKAGEFAPTLVLAERLLGDGEDLIHKAVGWMLREIGKRDPTAEEAFLIRHQRRMPRTMLRYAIERLPDARRREYLAGVAEPAAA